MTRKTVRFLPVEEALPLIAEGAFRLHYPGERPPSIEVRRGTHWYHVDMDVEDVLLWLTEPRANTAT